VSTTDLTPEAARQLRVKATEGALVVAVETGSSADKAGLRKGDVLVSANGRPIRGSADVRNRAGLTPIGEEIAVGIERPGGVRHEVRVRVAEPFTVTSSAGEAVPSLPGHAWPTSRRACRCTATSRA